MIRALRIWYACSDFDVATLDTPTDRTRFLLSSPGSPPGTASGAISRNHREQFTMGSIEERENRPTERPGQGPGPTAGADEASHSSSSKSSARSGSRPNWSASISAVTRSTRSSPVPTRSGSPRRTSTSRSCSPSPNSASSRPMISMRCGRRWVPTTCRCAAPIPCAPSTPRPARSRSTSWSTGMRGSPAPGPPPRSEGDRLCFSGPGGQYAPSTEGRRVPLHRGRLCDPGDRGRCGGAARGREGARPHRGRKRCERDRAVGSGRCGCPLDPSTDR